MKRVEQLLSAMATPDNLTKREFLIGDKKAVMLFNPDISDEAIARTAILALTKAQAQSLEQLKNCVINSAEAVIKQEGALDDALKGDCVLIVDEIEGYLVISAKKWEKRSIMEPPVETVQHGPREGFVEDIKTNISLITRRLTSPAFAIERFKIGRVTQTTVALLYVSTIADPKFVNLIRKKLKNIDVDALIDSHYLQPLMQPHPNSIFNQMGTTEKPDVVSAKLLEGRVAILVDGSPVALTAPFLLIEDFQSAEDYYTKNTLSSFLRILRVAATLISIFLPGAYVAMQVFHYNIIPIKFLITLMNAVKGIPLSPLVEILFVLALFEIIREASVRTPRAVGMAMSIVGGLVLGETAVKSGMISSPAVMVVALSSIALYTAPNQVGVISLLRIAFTILGGLAGVYGLAIGVVFTLAALVNFDSFGTPYLAPFAPLVFPDLKDSLLMAGTSRHKKRPYSLPNINRTRQK